MIKRKIVILIVLTLVLALLIGFCFMQKNAGSAVETQPTDGATETATIAQTEVDGEETMATQEQDVTEAEPTEEITEPATEPEETEAPTEKPAEVKPSSGTSSGTSSQKPAETKPAETDPPAEEVPETKPEEKEDSNIGNMTDLH